MKQSRQGSIGTMSLGEAQLEWDSEPASTIVPPLKSVACGREDSGEKEIQEAKDEEEMFGLLQYNVAEHM